MAEPSEPTPETAQMPTPAPAAPDIQAQINQALKAQQAEFAKQLQDKSLTDAQLKAQGKLQELADSKAQEAATYKQQLHNVNITNALLNASGEAIDPATISALLAAKAVCDDSGAVTIDGKPVAEAVKALLTDKPFWLKPKAARVRVRHNKRQPGCLTRLLKTVLI
ncbi:MAG: hypothetical protein ACNA7G_09630 [Methylobacter sp.]